MRYSVFLFALMMLVRNTCAQKQVLNSNQKLRQRISINEDWRFMRYTSEPDKLIYDERPSITDRRENEIADARPIELNNAPSSNNILKEWILPTANDFIKDPLKHHQRPAGNPGSDFPFVQNDFNDF
jgi:beta-galactosidase